MSEHHKPQPFLFFELGFFNPLPSLDSPVAFASDADLDLVIGAAVPGVGDLDLVQHRTCGTLSNAADLCACASGPGSTIDVCKDDSLADIASSRGDVCMEFSMSVGFGLWDGDWTRGGTGSWIGEGETAPAETSGATGE